MNDNDAEPAKFMVIKRAPGTLHIPCIFCGKRKIDRPEMEFVTDANNAICTECIDEAYFLINNADRPSLQDWIVSTADEHRRKVSADICDND